MKHLKLSVFVMSVMLGTAAFAKLPPPTPEQIAATEATKAKAAETAKKDAELLAKYQDRAVANYKQGKQAMTSATPAAVSTKR
ncbi:MAG TPA: hypothetical protein VJU83_02510 [Burkholderiales bacterium]|nr:hypothetical protein [Burkholderiales bacterium]